MKICVLSGGWSSERAVSIRTGQAIAKALESLGHVVIRLDPKSPALEGLPADADLVFIALHGEFGEDGQLQEILERRGLRYTGSGAAASRLAIDKVASREAFARAGLAVAPGAVVKRGESCDAARLERAIGPPPWFVKPSAAGSSVGVTRVEDPSALAGALVEAFRHGPVVLVEKGIAGREFTLGILGDQALPLIELKPKRDFYDYTAKYAADSGTEYVVDPPLDAREREALESAGREAFAALGCRGCGRVDLILSSSKGGEGIPHVLEVNTIPGMTEKSLLPKAAAAAGIPFVDLCRRIADLGLESS